MRLLVVLMYIHLPWACISLPNFVFLSFRYDHPGDLNEPARFWRSMADWVHIHFPTKPFFISETGAAGVFEWNNSTDPRWSQKYQVEVVERDAQFAMSNDNISGITIWQVCESLREREGRRGQD